MHLPKRHLLSCDNPELSDHCRWTLSRNFTTNTRRLFIASTWFVAMAFHSPYLYKMKLVNYENNLALWQFKWIVDNSPAFLRYNIFLFVTALLIPLVTILFSTPSFRTTFEEIKWPSNEVPSEKSNRVESVKWNYFGWLLLLYCHL